MATSYHITNAVEVTADAIQILYPRVLVSKGTLFGFQITVAVSETDLELKWMITVFLEMRKQKIR